MTKVKELMKPDTNTEVIGDDKSTVNQHWEDIEDIEVPNYVAILELVHAVSICCDNHSYLQK